MYQLNVVVADHSILSSCHSGGATTLSFVMKGANAVGSFVMRSIVSGTVFDPPDGTTDTYKFFRVSTLEYFHSSEAITLSFVVGQRRRLLRHALNTPRNRVRAS